MDFYFPDFSARIDWRHRPRFRDKELARLAFGARPDVMVADKLVEVCLHEGRGRRVRDYHDRICEGYCLPVVSLALLADEHPHWRPRGFHQRMHDTVTDFSFGTAKLLDYTTDALALEATRNPIAWVSLVHVRTQQTHHDPNQRYAAKLRLTKLLFRHGWRQRRIIVLFNVISWMMTLPKSHERRYRQAIERLIREHEMKKEYNSFQQLFVDDGIKIGQERGRQEGIEQGIEQGRKEGAVALLERQLVQRFGPLPQTAHKKLAKASLAQVETWSDALAAAESLKQVFR